MAISLKRTWDLIETRIKQWWNGDSPSPAKKTPQGKTPDAGENSFLGKGMPTKEQILKSGSMDKLKQY